MLICKNIKEVPKSYSGVCKVESPGGWISIIHFVNGLIHREDGPARIDDNIINPEIGQTIWSYNDDFHRLDGPAVVTYKGEIDFYIFGDSFSEQTYWNDPRVIEYKLNKIISTNHD